MSSRISVLGAPKLVDREKFLRWARQPGSDLRPVILLSRTYEDDRGQIRYYDVEITCEPFGDEAVLIRRIEAIANTGYRKYGGTWRHDIERELREIEADPSQRVVREGNTIRVLMGLSFDGSGSYRYVTVKLANPNDVRLLIEDTESGERWYLYEGNVYTRDGLLLPYTQHKSVDDLISYLTTVPLDSVSSRYQADWVIVDGVPYRLLCQRHELRFLVAKSYDIAVVRIGHMFSGSARFKTWREVLDCISGAYNEQAIRGQYVIHDPELLGSSVPSFAPGDAVLVKIADLKDKRSRLNGLRGVVMNRNSDGQYRVRFFDYWDEHFTASELLRAASTEPEKKVS